jgi:hypothetical protein
MKAHFSRKGLNGSTHLYRRGYGTQMNGGRTKLREPWQSQDHIHYTCKSDKVVVETDGELSWAEDEWNGQR